MLFLLLCVQNIVGIFKKIKRQGEQSEYAALNDSTLDSENQPLDYMKILQYKKLTFEKSRKSKSRSAIAEYSFDGKYHIDICKLKTHNDRPLADLMVETHKDSHVTYGSVYTLLNSFNDYEISYKFGGPDTISKIYLNIFGGRFKTIIKNDTLTYYASRFKNFYIKYNFKAAQDFFGSIKDTLSSLTVPIEIIFLRSKGDLFFILMTPIQRNVDIVPGTLLTLIGNDRYKRE